MDFVDYGDFSTILRIQDAFSRFAAMILWAVFVGVGGWWNKDDQAAEMVLAQVVSNWLSAFGDPGIIVAGADSRLIGKISQDFCTSRNICPQAVIPGRHQSLGAVELRLGHFRLTSDHTNGNRTR